MFFFFLLLACSLYLCMCVRFFFHPAYVFYCWAGWVEYNIFINIVKDLFWHFVIAGIGSENCKKKKHQTTNRERERESKWWQKRDTVIIFVGVRKSLTYVKYQLKATIRAILSILRWNNKAKKKSKSSTISRSRFFYIFFFPALLLLCFIST